MLLKTFKGRILTLSLGMTIFSVSFFGYGLSGIYHEHMRKCVTRSLTFLTNMLSVDYNLRAFNPNMREAIFGHAQLKNVLKGGLIDDLHVEVLHFKPKSTPKRIYVAKHLGEGKYFIISSSTANIDKEVIAMFSDRWVYFVVGFVLSTALILLLIRLLFAPLGQLVRHCLTCDDPQKLPQHVSGGEEIVALRDAIATLQGRISKLQNAQHDSMKALAHELKTPLAQLRLRIDVASQNGTWNGASIDEARSEIDAIAAKITQILQSSAAVQKNSTLNVAHTIDETIEVLHSLWQHKNLTVQNRIEGKHDVFVPKEVYTRVVRVLVENSINHCANSTTIIIEYIDEMLYITNQIAKNSQTLIDSSGKGLNIAHTLCTYYNWKLTTQKKGTTFVAKLSVV